jgi:eukaryotic-like serine/threonine-protein kinase
VLASVSPSKRLVFSVLSLRINLWTLALDANGVTPASDAARITDDEAAGGFSSLTTDGDLLLFSSNRSGRTQIWSKDLKTGKEVPVTDGPFDEAPVVTSDGSRFVYQAHEDHAKYVVASGATSAHPRSRRKIVEGDGWPASWSTDGAWLFYSVRAERWGIEAVHAASGRKYVVFQHPGFDLTSFYPSPDNRWAVASAYEDPVSRILLAPLRELTTIKPADWISIADDAAEHDRPMWSSDGTLVYYTSFRDGFRCIWAQRLDNDSKRPSGPAVPVYHSHSARMSLRNAGQSHFKIAVARDRLVFNMGELRGNLWMATLPN